MICLSRLRSARYLRIENESILGSKQVRMIPESDLGFGYHGTLNWHSLIEKKE